MAPGEASARLHNCSQEVAVFDGLVLKKLRASLSEIISMDYSVRLKRIVMTLWAWFSKQALGIKHFQLGKRE